MPEKFDFCFFGGTNENRHPHSNTTTICKFFLFGIVGGKENISFELTKTGLVSTSKDASASKALNIPKSFVDRFKSSTVFTTQICTWKLFTSAVHHGIYRHSYSIYFRLTNDPLIPVSKLISIADTDYYRACVNNMYPGYSTSTSKSMFHLLGRFQIIPRKELPSILNKDALRWAVRIRQPPIPIFKEMLSVCHESTKKGRVIRMRKE